VASVVRDVMEGDKGLSGLTTVDIDAKAQEMLGKGVKIGEGPLEEATDPEACLMRRKSEGSPHPAQGEITLEKWVETLKVYEAKLAERKGKIFDAMQSLKETVEGYISG